MIRSTDARVADAAIHAHARLDGPLPLDALATVAGLSPHHFHRRFRAAFGESPAAYVRRLRLERAAWRLQLHSDSVLAIALDCGFADHETFSRAFRRRWGLSPSDYRRLGRLPGKARRDRDQGGADGDYFVSPTRIRTLAARTIAFIRQIGPYERVEPGLWAELDRWADGRGLPRERALLGIGHDAPGITAADQLRFDAAVTVPAGTPGDERVRVAALPAWRCAVTTHVGAYASLPEAYPQVFEQSLAAAPDLLGLPVIELYDDQTVCTDRPVSRTEIHLPILRLPDDSES
ncbi:MAG TPA: helix-turn-helix domain-containing protein [Allosphingosinicella sp.]